MLRHDHTRTCLVRRQRMSRNIWYLEIYLILYGVLQILFSELRSCTAACVGTIWACPDSLLPSNSLFKIRFSNSLFDVTLNAAKASGNVIMIRQSMTKPFLIACSKTLIILMLCLYKSDVEV